MVVYSDPTPKTLNLSQEFITTYQNRWLPRPIVLLWLYRGVSFLVASRWRNSAKKPEPMSRTARKDTNQIQIRYVSDSIRPGVWGTGVIPSHFLLRDSPLPHFPISPITPLPNFIRPALPLPPTFRLQSGVRGLEWVPLCQSGMAHPLSHPFSEWHVAQLSGKTHFTNNAHHSQSASTLNVHLASPLFASFRHLYYLCFHFCLFHFCLFLPPF